MPKIEDNGVADVDISQGTGLSLKIVWKLKSSAGSPYQLSLLKCKCNIDRLSITVRSARHSILDKLVTKLFAGTIKRQVANAIVTNIIKTLNPMNTKFNEFFKSRPLSGMGERVNDGIKSTMFTGTSDEKSLLQKAKEGVSTGIVKAKEMSQSHNSNTSGTHMPMTETHTMPMTGTHMPMTGTHMPMTGTSTMPMTGTSTMPMTSGTHMPMSGSSMPPSYTQSMSNTENVPFTFTERQKKGWNFEWYSPLENAQHEHEHGVNSLPMNSMNLNETKYEQKLEQTKPYTSI
jgi:hypothetical protein